MKIIALYNIKGGVGKTAACVNLSYSCASSGIKTLLWDLDVQGAASFYFNIKPEIKGGTKKLFKAKELGSYIIESQIEYLDILPADFSYRNMDLFLDSEKKSKKRMREFLEQLEDDYEVIFLDCPPSFSLVSENVFNAADCLLIPLIPTTLSMRTYYQILEYVTEHKKSSLQLLPFFSMADKRKKLHADTIKEGFNKIEFMLKTVIPYLSIIEYMGIKKAPVGVFAKNSYACKLFNELWNEIVLRCKINQTETLSKIFRKKE